MWFGVVFVLWSCLSQAQTPLTANPSRLLAATAGAGCIVSEFMGIGLTNHDPIERSTKAYQWLEANKTGCDSRKLQALIANRGHWLGTSDSPQMFATLNIMLEAKLKDSPELMDKALGFSSAAPASAPAARSDEVLKVKIQPAAGAKPQGFGASPFGGPSPFGSPSPFGGPSPFGSPSPFGGPSPFGSPTPSAGGSPFANPSPVAGKPAPSGKP